MSKLDIRETLQQLESQLEKMIRNAERSAKNQQSGTLRITTIKGKPRYYHNYTDEKGHKHSDYLSFDKNAELIRILAQGSYDTVFLKIAYKQLRAVKRALKSINEDVLSNVFSQLPDERKKLIIPHAPDETVFVRDWESDLYLPGNFSEKTPEIYTEKGERVRSKSEKIIADKYNILGIPYKYEKPLVLFDQSHPITVRPDFTVLNKRTLQQRYHEHFGKMDDPKYVSGAINKIRLYEKNGIFVVDQLFLTMEASGQPLDMKTFELLIDKYLR